MAKLELYGPDRKHGAKPRKGFKRYVWYIVWREDGRAQERSTGFGVDERVQAERELGKHIITHAERSGPVRPRGPSEIRIADVLSAYLKEHAWHVADPARLAYAADALLGFWGDRFANAITGATCRSYIKHRVGSGRAYGTARRELGCLGTALRHCEREGYITSPPRVVLPPRPPSRDRWLSRPDVAALIRAARQSPKARGHLPLFILAAVYTGKRSEAIRTLQWQPNTEGDGWVDLENETIHWGYSGTKKRRGEPTPIPRPLLTHLRYQRRRTRKYVLEPTRPGRCSTGSFKTAWRACVERSGIAPARMHDMRHTAASVLLSAGVPLWKAAKYLGVSTETLEKTYGHLVPGALDEAAAAVTRKR